MVRSYLNRHLTPLLVLVLGLVWFSVEAWQNALSAFQLSWYVILFLLMSMLYLLLMRTSVFAFGLATAAAVAASFSFLQGLALWPVGLVCLVWALPTDPRRWKRIQKAEILVWLGTGTGTMVASLWGYRFKPLGCVVQGQFRFTCSGSVSSFALHHPLRTAEFVFVEIGDVIPNSTASTLWMSGLLGAGLFVVAVFVVVQSVRRRLEVRNCLPVALITFGLLFDLLVAVAHVELLTQAAPSSTFTMPNLLILIAIITYAWGHIGFGSGRLTKPSVSGPRVPGRGPCPCASWRGNTLGSCKCEILGPAAHRLALDWL